MEISDKVNVNKLVGKKIFLLTNNRWEEGAVYTSNKFDYQFLYFIFSNCIGSISVGEMELKKHGKDCFELQEKTGITFYHGGKNPFSMGKKPDWEYITLRNFLNSAINQN
ncbi:hypothetical protein M0R72_04465 [Candidatus Pacearchaeota archaeon]|nr:hypothetical protein [Candidatus Pacearchaeota archaeon]